MEKYINLFNHRLYIPPDWKYGLIGQELTSMSYNKFDWKPVISWVPQGSVLGLLLFANALLCWYRSDM